MSNTHKSILILHSSSDLYGASKILLTTIKIFKENGFIVEVVLSEEGRLSYAIREESIKVYIIRLGILRRKYFNIKGIFNRVFVVSKAYKQLLNIIEKEDFTHIYSNTTAVLVGALVAKKTKTYHIWHIHEIITNPMWFTRIMGSFVNRYSDYAIAVSEAVSQYWRPYISKEKLKVIYNGIDYTPYLSPTKSFRELNGINQDVLLIGMIGRISAWKGQLYFLDIADQIVKNYSNVHFLIVGDAFPGDEHLLTALNKKILKLNLENVVTVLDFQQNVSSIYEALDIFVLPSIKPDPLPTVVLEAMASAKAVIATGHGGALEMVLEGKTGIFIPHDNAKAAYQKIKLLLSDSLYRNNLGHNGRERVLKAFSEDSFKINIMEIFKDTESK
ncbi:hypothetical protein EL17_12100 [Anditalea andensis]|uniref:Glycosyl transferase family 1 n=2 Tax=Anditalea andensis TaxID=1048983 RepID=A0A074KZM7_9BACT|nr:hypothetical protein EL17_12100 [Anditalea andensis]